MSSNVAGSLGGLVGGFMPSWIAFLFPALAVYADLPAAQTPFAYGTAIVIASVITGLAVIPILRLIVPVESVTAKSGVAGRGVPWRTLLPRGFPMLFFGITGGLTFPFYSLFFRNVHHAPDALVGTILSFGFFMMAFPVLFGPQLERRFGRSQSLLLATGSAGLCFVGLSLAPTIGTATLFFVCAISLRNIINGIYPPMLLAGLPLGAHNAASSVGFLGWNIGWLVGTSLGGFLTAQVGYTLVLQGVGVGVFLIGVSAWWIFRREAFANVPVRGAPAPVTPSEP
jgi:predicted MFS family arabinose efflux permease